MATIGKIRVDLQGDTRQFQRSMTRAQRSVAGVTRSVRTMQRSLAFVAGGLGIGLMIRNTGQQVLRMQQLADRLAVSTEEFSKLTRVMGRSGIRMESLAMMLQRMMRRAAEAQEGNERLQETFAALNIDVDEFIKLDAVTQFEILGRALSQVENDAHRARLAFAILDSEGVQALQANLAELNREMARTPGITDRQAEALTRAAASWDKVKEAAQSAFLAVGENTGFFGLLERGLGTLSDFFSPNDPAARRRMSMRAAESRAARARTNRQIRELLSLVPIIGPLPESAGPPPVTAPLTGTIGGPRVLQGGDLGRTNQLLEQIRRNTGSPQPAVAQ